MKLKSTVQIWVHSILHLWWGESLLHQCEIVVLSEEAFQFELVGLFQ